MNFNVNFKEFLQFIVINTAAMFILMVTLEAIFVIHVPHQDAGWCVKFNKIEKEFGNPLSEAEYTYECLEFKNDFEKRIEMTNIQMGERKVFIRIVVFLVGFLVAFGYFHLYPLWKGKSNVFRHLKLLHFLTDMPVIAVAALISAIFLPLLIIGSLPHAEIWYFQIFYDYNYSVAMEILETLK